MAIVAVDPKQQASQLSDHLPRTALSVEIVNLIESEKTWLVLHLFLDDIRDLDASGPIKEHHTSN